MNKFQVGDRVVRDSIMSSQRILGVIKKVDTIRTGLTPECYVVDWDDGRYNGRYLEYNLLFEDEPFYSDFLERIKERLGW